MSTNIFMFSVNYNLWSSSLPYDDLAIEGLFVARGWWCTTYIFLWVIAAFSLYDLPSEKAIFSRVPGHESLSLLFILVERSSLWAGVAVTTYQYRHLGSFQVSIRETVKKHSLLSPPCSVCICECVSFFKGKCGFQGARIIMHMHYS